MKLVTKRCQHCNTVYHYKASGEGCFNELNNENYCPTCYQEILNTLKSIPKKFEKRFNDTPIEYDDKIWQFVKDDLENLNEDDFEVTMPNALGSMQLVICNPVTMQLINKIQNKDDDSVFDGYVIKGIEYLVHSNKETYEIINIYRLDEYDIINNKFTGNSWDQRIDFNDYPTYYKYNHHIGRYATAPFFKSIRSEDVPVVNLDMPTGDFPPIVDFGPKILDQYNIKIPESNK